MSNIRIVKDQRFNGIKIMNEMFEDESISCACKGFISYCLTKPENWNFNVSHLCSVLKEGRDAIYSIINQCIDAGYAYRYQPRSKTNQFLPQQIVVSDSKQEIADLKNKIELEIEEFKKWLQVTDIPGSEK